MNLNNIASLEQLFSVWEQAHHEEPEEIYLSYGNPNICKNIFFPDGIIRNEAYREKQKQGKSILFIGKEGNEFAKNRTPDSHPTFWLKKVAFGESKTKRLSQGLSMLANAYYNDDYSNDSKDKGHAILQSVAFMNLNKRGGFSKCNEKTLEGYVAQYAEFIRREIELIHPHVILCCGMGLRDLLLHHVSVDASNIFDVYHPSYYGVNDEIKLQELKRCIEAL